MEKEVLQQKILEYAPGIGQRMKCLEKTKQYIEKIEQSSYNKKEEEIAPKKIAIVYDVDGWAFHNIAKEIKRYLSKDYEVNIFPKSVFDHNVVKMLLLTRHYNLIHVLWRGMFSELEGEYLKGYIKNMGFQYEEFIQKYVLDACLTTSVYDHSFLNEDAFWITNSFLKYTKGYTVSSKKLLSIYQNLPIELKPYGEISDGVDLAKFKPENLERFSQIKDRKIRIGWVGNSKFLDSEQDEDLKGVRQIILPVIEDLIKEGYPVEKKFADRNDKFIPHEQMPQYYNSIDLYICASKEEGTPNPVLESMACGVPIITTNVGIVSEVFGENQERFILKSRSKEELKKKIIELMENPDVWQVLSQENLEQIKQWSWENKCEQFKEFFEQYIKRGEN